MLSYQRQAEKAGHSVKFFHRDHEVEPERLERAMKRRKHGGASVSDKPNHVDRLDQYQDNPVLPPYIHACMSRIQVSDCGRNVTSTLPNTAMDTIPRPRWQENDRVMDLDEEGSFSSVREPITLRETVQGSMNSDTAQAAETTSAGLPTEGMAISGMFEPSCRGDPQSTMPNGLLSSVDSQNYEWSQIAAALPSAGMPMAADSILALGRETAKSNSTSLDPGSVLAPRQGSRHNDMLFEPITNSSPDLGTFKLPHDLDIKLVYGTLAQLLHGHFLDAWKQSPLTHCSSGDHTQREFDELVGSQWLRDELDEIANDMQQRDAKVSCDTLERSTVFQDPRSSLDSILHDRDVQRGPPDMPTGVLDSSDWQRGDKLSSHLMLVAKTGTLRLHLRTRRPPKSRASTTNACDLVTVTFIPATRIRAIGISAIIFRIFDRLLTPCISHQIKAFNVVPQNSPIIRAVSCNDIPVIRGLFDRGEASPLDVDPHGFSLLSVSVRSMQYFHWLIMATVRNCRQRS